MSSSTDENRPTYPLLPLAIEQLGQIAKQSQLKIVRLLLKRLATRWQLLLSDTPVHTELLPLAPTEILTVDPNPRTTVVYISDLGSEESLLDDVAASTESATYEALVLVRTPGLLRRWVLGMVTRLLPSPRRSLQERFSQIRQDVFQAHMALPKAVPPHVAQTWLALVEDCLELVVRADGQCYLNSEIGKDTRPDERVVRFKGYSPRLDFEIIAELRLQDS